MFLGYISFSRYIIPMTLDIFIDIWPLYFFHFKSSLRIIPKTLKLADTINFNIVHFDIWILYLFLIVMKKHKFVFFYI